MERERELRRRYFSVSFVLAFMAVSAIFVILVFYAHPTAPRALQAETPINTVTYVPKKEDSLTVLLILAPSLDSEADVFLLARFDPVGGGVPVTAFPPQTLVQNGAKTESLSQVYTYGGAEYVCGALADSMGITIHRYMRASQESFATAAAAVGGVEYDLSWDLTLNRDGAPVEMPAGTHLLDGKQMAEVMRYPDYEGGEAARCQVIEDLAVAAVNQRQDVVLSTLADTIFQTVVSAVNTNISYADYDSRKDAAEYLARFQKEPGYAVRLSGEFSGNGEVFRISDTSLAQLRKTYG